MTIPIMIQADFRGEVVIPVIPQRPDGGEVSCPACAPDMNTGRLLRNENTGKRAFLIFTQGHDFTAVIGDNQRVLILRG